MVNNITNQQKLTRLIEIAENNGYKLNWVKVKLKELEIEFFSNNAISFLMGEAEYRTTINDILFSHDFAKAIFGEEGVCSLCGDTNIVQNIENDFGVWRCFVCNSGVTSSWQHHIQQAVISDDPLEYYWENK